MIIILKIILTLFIAFGWFIGKTLYQDLKQTEKTPEYEESTVADKIKIKSMLYFSLITIIAFCLLLLYFVVSPMQITW